MVLYKKFLVLMLTGGLAVLSASPLWGESALRVLTVRGTSMEPTLHPGDRVQVHTGYYDTHSVERNDLVAIRFSGRPSLVVKRAVAVAGDRVNLEQGRLTVNGHPLTTSGGNQPRQFTGKTSKVLNIQLKRYGGTIPSRQVIVAGDNPHHSFDSGDFGMISQDQVIGRVIPESKEAP